MDKWGLLKMLGEYLPQTKGYDEPYVDEDNDTVSIILGSYLDVAESVQDGSTIFLCLSNGMELLLRDVVRRLARRVSPRFNWRRVWDRLPKFSGQGLDRFNAALAGCLAEDIEHRYRVYAQYHVRADMELGVYAVQPAYDFVMYRDLVRLPEFVIPLLSSTVYARECIEQDGLCWGY